MTQSGDHLSRRHWLAVSSGALGAGLAGRAAFSASLPQPTPTPRPRRLPREIWVATISQNNLNADNPDAMIRRMLALMEETLVYDPDIICLPEVFHVANQPGARPSLTKSAESPVGDISAPFSKFAKAHNCYVVCPIYTVHEGRYYNAAVFLDRAGGVLGEYRKMHPTIGEIEQGIVPGSLDPPVFQTDFGRVGAQICFDIEWTDGWQALARKGAEIVFWPSAFSGGAMVNHAACRHMYCVVSSTRKGASKICDLAGVETAKTGHFAQWTCGPINLEKTVLHTWPYCQRFKDIQARYGRKVRLTTFHDEEWTLLESVAPDVNIQDLLNEFDLKTHRDHIQAADTVQKEHRPRGAAAAKP